jgi:hypothetical protein
LRDAGGSQRSIARELNIDRRKVKQIIDHDDAVETARGIGIAASG